MKLEFAYDKTLYMYELIVHEHLCTCTKLKFVG